MMANKLVIDLGPEIEKRLAALSEVTGLTVDALVQDCLDQTFADFDRFEAEALKKHAASGTGED